MSTETIQKRPTTLAELGMKMIEDNVCPACERGNCHTKGIAISTTFHNGTFWTIHISVNKEYCTDPNGTYVYKGTFTIDPTNTSNLNKPDKYFTNELECVDYLLDNFTDIECKN